jgi:trypsin
MIGRGRVCRTLLACAALSVSSALALASSASAIVGGAPASLEHFPWQAAIYVEPEAGKASLVCGGSILGVGRVLTAAHCVAGRTRTDLRVVAGAAVAPAEKLPEGVGVQIASVAGERLHPDYEPPTPPSPAVDDVAVLELAAPLTLSSTVGAIALPTSSVPPEEGGEATISGFGEEAPGEAPSGALNSLATTLGFTRAPACIGEGAFAASALFLCASGASGSACTLDGGGALVAGTPPSVIGVLETAGSVAGVSCAAGSQSAFANVTAPEIREFVEGDEPLPLAPRGKGVLVHGVLGPGHALTCESGTWTNEPTFTFSFVDAATRQVLQSGPPQSGSASTYALTAADIGRRIYCQVQASNEGGMAVARTLPLAPIEAPSPTATTAASQTTAGEATRAAGTGVLGSTTPTVSRARIAALLKRALAPSGRAARIAPLTRAGSFTVAFAAPEAGTVRIYWYRGATGTRGITATPLLIASGHLRFLRAGTGRIVVRLTPAGRRALRDKRHFALNAKGSFTPLGGAAITVGGALALSR